MTFLKNIDSLSRLEIQYKAFIATRNLSFLNSILDIPSFKNVFKEYIVNDISQLNVENNLRLGNRLEHFLSFALEQSNDFTILAKNVQIIENKITLGELDYVIQDNRINKIFHLELANKFYLFDESIPKEIEKWIGPNRKDSLIRKITKLKNKQFPLLYQKQTKKQMNELGIRVESLEQKILFKTQLFLPLDKYNGSEENDNVEGFFISKKDFSSAKYYQSQYFIPEKQDWQVNPEYCENWFSYEEVQASIKMYLAENKSPLLWLKKPDNSYEKFFIVWW